MKIYRIFAAVLVLVLVSLACQAVAGGGDDTSSPGSDESSLEVSPSDTSPGDAGSVSVETDFILTDDAFNVTDIGDGNVLFYTKMSLEDVMKFYRDEYGSRGYSEREILTVVNDGVFNLVFDGDPSGNAIVIQSVDLGDGSRTITIRLEDV